MPHIADQDQDLHPTLCARLVWGAQAAVSGRKQILVEQREYLQGSNRDSQPVVTGMLCGWLRGLLCAPVQVTQLKHLAGKGISAESLGQTANLQACMNMVLCLENLCHAGWLPAGDGLASQGPCCTAHRTRKRKCAALASRLMPAVGYSSSPRLSVLLF